MEPSNKLGVVILIAETQPYDMMPETNSTRGTSNMPDTTITTTDQSLDALLRTDVKEGSSGTRGDWVESYKSGQRFSDAAGFLYGDPHSTEG